jgi:hypothetical protein
MNHPTKSLSEFNILLESLCIVCKVQGPCRSPKRMMEIGNKSINWTISSVENKVSSNSIDGGPNDHSQELGLVSETNQGMTSACRHIVAPHRPILIDGVPISGDLPDVVHFSISILPR